MLFRNRLRHRWSSVASAGRVASTRTGVRQRWRSSRLIAAPAAYNYEVNRISAPPQSGHFGGRSSPVSTV